MNDIAFHVGHHIAADGGMAHADLADLYRRINPIPFKAVNYRFPRECLKALLSGSGTA